MKKNRKNSKIKDRKRKAKKARELNEAKIIASTQGKEAQCFFFFNYFNFMVDNGVTQMYTRFYNKERDNYKQMFT